MCDKTLADVNDALVKSERAYKRRARLLYYYGMTPFQEAPSGYIRTKNPASYDDLDVFRTAICASRRTVKKNVMRPSPEALFGARHRQCGEGEIPRFPSHKLDVDSSYVASVRIDRLYVLGNITNIVIDEIQTTRLLTRSSVSNNP